MLDLLAEDQGFIQLSQQPSKDTETRKIDHGRLTYIDDGILRIEANRAAELSLLLSCGIHGNETAPIEMLSTLIARIVRGELINKSDLLLVIGNPLAMAEAKRFHAVNLNRLFSGAHQQPGGDPEHDYEKRRAALLEHHAKTFFHQKQNKVHLDLHTAIKPSRHLRFAIQPLSNSSAAYHPVLAAMGIEALLQQNTPAGTFSHFTAAACDADAFTLELGKAKPFGENDPADFATTMKTLVDLITGNRPTQPDQTMAHYHVVAEIIKHSEQFRFYVPEDAENFRLYPRGYLIAEDGDYEYRVQAEQEAVIFPNPGVPVGQRVALMVQSSV